MYQTNTAFRLPNTFILDRNRERNAVFYGRVSTEHEAQLAALENQSRTVEELADATGMPAGTLLTLLARMELAGQVEQGPGRRYARAGSREY